MKLLFVVAAMIAAFALNAQTKFESAMQRGLGMMKDAKSASDMQEVSAFFERVGEAEKRIGSLFIMRHMPIYKAHG
ncbi:MAG: hypothetical protein IM534_10235 [Chitinophagaceae bacterium]|nr:hypothetical protein [Chitinophagaceae bacterium]